MDNTLSSIWKVHFFNCKITILDNSSTDKTQGIYDKYQKLFPKMKIMRNKKNIGGNPNILRASETSNYIYTWILWDYDFSDCQDLLDAIESERFNLIINFSHGFQNKKINHLITD